MDNPYIRLTQEFNHSRLRAILASGQAVVLYRLAIMSKDGDWILREEEEALTHVIATLARHGARYRYGAPLDLRWLVHGWSSHLEFREGGLRLRCDFVTRPPRVSPASLRALWEAPVQKEAPIVSLPVLAEIKKTNREKDYAVIGELARQMEDPRLEALYSRSARDLVRLALEHPEAIREAAAERPLLSRVGQGREEVERLLDEERRALRQCRYPVACGMAPRVEGDLRPAADRGARDHGHEGGRAPAGRTMSERRDEFLSDEDLDLKNLTALELETYWRLWLTQAQGTNDSDRASYSHGVFDRDPAVS